MQWQWQFHFLIRSKRLGLSCNPYSRCLSKTFFQKGFSLTSGLEKQRIGLKLSSKVNSALKSISIPTIKISIFAEIFE